MKQNDIVLGKKKKPVLEVLCSYCGEVIEREQLRKVNECFDCKKKRHQRAGQEYRAKMKG